MAVEVTIPKAASSATLTAAHENGESYMVHEGVLYIYNDQEYQSNARQVAVYAASQWLSAKVIRA